jgi:hypothetical protein
MILSKLVNFYNQLCAMTATAAKQSTNIELQKITHTSQDPELENLRISVLDSFDRFETEFNQLKHRIREQIEQEERPYIEDSYRIYEQNQSAKYEWFYMDLPESRPNYLKEQYEIREKNIQQQVDTILNTVLDISENAHNIILNRIIRYSGWQHSAMILHPGTESWIHHMVSNDPLYLVDESHDLLKPIMTQFNEVYQHRLRPYAIREDQEQDILWQLPNRQFGLVLAYNYFNRKPFEVIRQYLIEIYNKLSPGGVLAMTYNDCDRWPGVVAVESRMALYTPGLLIQSFAKSIGFEQIFIWHEDGPWTWIELQKPGELKSLRGGQTLARILPKPVAESK